MTIRKILEERLAGSGENPEAFHAAIVERSNLILRVQQLLQEGGFGDSSEEDVDEAAAPEGESSNRRKMDNAAKSQSSDAPPAPPALQPLAPQARARAWRGRGSTIWQRRARPSSWSAAPTR